MFAFRGLSSFRIFFLFLLQLFIKAILVVNPRSVLHFLFLFLYFILNRLVAKRTGVVSWIPPTEARKVELVQALQDDDLLTDFEIITTDNAPLVSICEHFLIHRSELGDRQL